MFAEEGGYDSVAAISPAVMQDHSSKSQWKLSFWLCWTPLQILITGSNPN